MARRSGRNRKRRAKQVNSGAPPLAQATPEQAWRRWESMHAGRQSMTPAEAIVRSSWVYTAITYIAENISRVPQRPRVRDSWADDHPLGKLIRQPNSYDDQNTSMKFRYAYFFELLLHGAVMRLFGDLSGFVPGTMAVRPRRHFWPQWSYDDFGRQVVGLWRLQRAGGGTRSFVPGDSILHDALYNPLHDYEGLSPLLSALVAISNDGEIMDYVRRFFDADGSTGLVFTTENPAFKQPQADEATRKWASQYSGTDNAFSAKFVGFGLKPHQIGNPLDARVLHILTGLTKEQIITGIFKIPLDAFSSADTGGGDIVIGGQAGGAVATARESALVNVIMPWAARYDEDFNRDVSWRFGGDVTVKHDFSDHPILEDKRLQRAHVAAELIDRGVTLNAVVKWLGLELEPFSHGDDWWVKNDRLPARLVLDAGPAARRIAIPEPGEQAAARQSYIDSILRSAQTVEIRNAVRESLNGRDLNGNAARIASLTNGALGHE